MYSYIYTHSDIQYVPSGLRKRQKVAAHWIRNESYKLHIDFSRCGINVRCEIEAVSKKQEYPIKSKNTSLRQPNTYVKEAGRDVIQQNQVRKSKWKPQCCRPTCVDEEVAVSLKRNVNNKQTYRGRKELVYIILIQWRNVDTNQRRKWASTNHMTIGARSFSSLRYQKQVKLVSSGLWQH